MAASAPTIWIVAGETSGDGYGARLGRELRGLCPEVVLKGMGGPAMREAGVEILVDSTELGVMGSPRSSTCCPFSSACSGVWSGGRRRSVRTRWC